MFNQFKTNPVDTNNKAVIYCRISSAKQKQGHGISSQKFSCQHYAGERGYDVIRVFTDEAYSGYIADRPGVQSMIDFLRTQKPGTKVIADDVSRIARNVEIYILLENDIIKSGGVLLTVKQNFTDDPEGLFMKRLATAQAEYDRNNNARRVTSRQIARVGQGYWCFTPFFGYSYGFDPAHGKIMIPDGYNATLATIALNNFASGQFRRIKDVMNYINEMGGIEKTRGKNRGKKGFCSYQVAECIIRNTWFYAGYIQYNKWGITRRKGMHDALISVEACHKIENRLNEKNAPKYNKRNEDFPLRGIVECAACGKLLTGCLSGGRHNKYAYYYCANEACIYRSKIIKRDLMHVQFEALLESLTPYPEVIDLINATMRRLWENRMAEHDRMKKEWEQELRSIASDKTGLVKSLKDAPDDVRKLIYDEI